MNKETLNAACAEIPQFREKLANVMELEMKLTAKSAYVAAKEVIGVVSGCKSKREFELADAMIEAFCGCNFETLIERAKGKSFKGKNISVAKKLPAGWHWKDYEDGSGALYDPKGKAVYSYDMAERTYAGEIVIHNEDKHYPLPAGSFFDGSLSELKSALEGIVLANPSLTVMHTISEEQLNTIKGSYDSNKEEMQVVAQHIATHGCTDSGLCDASESFEQGFNNGMEFIFDTLGIEY